MVGRTVLQYQFIEKLGSGGMGEIFKAQDTKLNRTVAIKVLPSAKSGDPERRRRFIQEAQAASALNHPNIITIHDIVTEDDTQFMVMEYVAGQTLLDLIPASGMAVPQVLQYGTQMADALATAHAAGIIHRDFKPANVMVTASGLVKVLDFGLAKLSGPATQLDPDATAATPLTVEGSIMGTVSYMSPEQAEGKRVDARSDIFSFGSVLYEMMTGRRAFHGDSSISTLSAVLRDDIKPISDVRSDVPPLLEVIIARCLQKDPDARWQTMKEAGDALSTLKRTLDSGAFDRPAVASVAVPASSVTAPPPPSAAQPPKTVPAAAASTPTPPVKPPAPKQTKAEPPKQSSSKTRMAYLIGGVALVIIAIGGGLGWQLVEERQEAQRQAERQAQQQREDEQKRAEAEAQKKAQEQAQAVQAAPEENAPAAGATPPETAPSTPATKVVKPKSKPSPLPSPGTKIETKAPAPVTTATQSEVAKAPPPKPAAPPPARAPVVNTVSVTVPDSMPFYVTLDDDVTSDAQGGQQVTFTVRDGLKVGDDIVIGKGTKVTGSIMGEVGKKFLGMGSKKMMFRLMQAKAVDGQQVNVRATAGKGTKGGPPERPFDTGKGSKSKELAAPKGTEYIAYTDGEQSVSVRK